MKYSILFFFVIIINHNVISQHKRLSVKQSGWPVNSIKELPNSKILINSDDSLNLDLLSVESLGSNIALQNKVWDIGLQKGAIALSLCIDYVGEKDTSEIGVFIIGKRGKTTGLYLAKPINKGNEQHSNNRVHITLPFEHPLDTIAYGIYSKSKAKFQLSNLRLDISEGEYAPEWRAKYSNMLDNEEGITDYLFALCKIWGFLKYHAPLISKNDIDWDQSLLDALDILLRENSASVFASVVDNMISVAVGTDMLSTDPAPNELLEKSSQNEKINLNHGWIEYDPVLTSSIRSKLTSIKNSYSPFENKYVAVPEQTNKPAPNFFENTYHQNALPHLNFRLLALFRYWNIIEYYYPYKYMVNGTWDDELKRFIPRFIGANTSLTYSKELALMNAAIQDGHARLTDMPILMAGLVYEELIPLPLKFHVINPDRVYISDIDSAFSIKSGLKKGMQVHSINGIEMQNRVNHFIPYISHSREDIKLHYINKNFLMSFVERPDDSLSISYSPHSLTDTISYKLDAQNIFKEYTPYLSQLMWPLRSGGRKGYEQIDSTTLYLNSYYWSENDSTATVEAMKKSKYVIIDTRDYCTTPFRKFASSFIEEPTDYVKFMYPRYYPGLLKEVTVPTSRPDYYFDGKIVVLISENTLSMPELLLMQLKARKDGMTVIGRASAGADGDVTTVPMIGQQNFQFIFSGLRVLFPDETETQGVGISPDIVVEKSYQEAILGEDSILKEALNYIVRDQDEI